MRKKQKLRRIPDLPLVLIILCLLLFGIVMVYDASVVYAQDVFGGKYYFLILQSFNVLVALTVAFVISRLDYHVLEKYSAILLLVSLTSLGLLSLYRILPEGLLKIYELFIPEINGAHRWFYLNPKPLPAIPILGRISFQPSEFAKIALSIYLASLLSSSKRKEGVLLHAVVVTMILGGLIIIQPDFGTAVIFVSILLLVYYVSGPPRRNLIFVGALVLLFALTLVGSSAYRRQRLLTFFYPSQSDPLSSRYQINQVLIAIGSGGFGGLGFGKSIQKYGYIPEVSTDSIFAVVGEEFGFVGTFLLVFLFFLLLYRSIWIVGRLPDEFGRLLGTGIVGFIGFQIFINLFSMAHLIPLTGVPLPLISYGGSSLVANLFALGILLNMTRQVKVEK